MLDPRLFLMTLFTEVPRREILRSLTSALRSSRKFVSKKVVIWHMCLTRQACYRGVVVRRGKAGSRLCSHRYLIRVR
jgi:hypothetical protein